MAARCSVMLLILTISVSSVVCQPPQTNWEWIRGLNIMTPRDFGKAIRPVLLITINAYRNTRSALRVPGWQPTALVPPLNLEETGAAIHAVSYEEMNTGRIVVAFKGATSQADFCAAGGIMGAGGVGNGPECKTFSPRSLDYRGQAIAYVRRVMMTYPGRPVLISGHSMGSFLAVLTSAALSSSEPEVTLPVLSFSGAVDKGLLAYKKLVLRAAERGLAYVVSNKWDFAGNPSQFGRNDFSHAGMLCTFGSRKPPACNACKSNGNPMLVGGACGQCFTQAHALETLLQLVDSGSRAICRSKN